MTEIRDEDIEVIASSALRVGRGGQQVAPQPGVVVIHRPTGIAAIAEDERSQLANRAAAIAKLCAVLNARQLADQLEAALAEIKWLQRKLKSITYYEIHDGAITLLTDKLEAVADGTALHALACDAATNIRQLQQTNARAEAESARMRPVIDAAEEWYDLRKEFQQRETFSLRERLDRAGDRVAGAVDAYRAVTRTP